MSAKLCVAIGNILKITKPLSVKVPVNDSNICIICGSKIELNYCPKCGAKKSNQKFVEEKFNIHDILTDELEDKYYIIDSENNIDGDYCFIGDNENEEITQDISDGEFFELPPKNNDSFKDLIKVLDENNIKYSLLHGVYSYWY